MKPFNLEEYLANPSRKLVTKEGKKVRIICTDKKGNDYPIVALIEQTYGESYVTYNTDGKAAALPDSHDLFFAPEKKKGWISIYKTESGQIIPGGYIDESEEASRKRSVPYIFSVLIKTIKIEWEE